MNKAEERAKEAYPLRDAEHVYDEERVIEARGYFIEGYHQAEKDLELTWKDMMTIDDLLDELLPPRRDSDELVLKGYYEEVLKRFKEKK